MKQNTDRFDLNGKVVRVLFRSGVLGGGMARTLAAAGAGVAIFYSGNQEGAEEHKEAIEKMGGEAMICKADARDEQELKKAFHLVKEKWGGIDVLVNAPGVNSVTPVMVITEEEWDRFMDNNTKGVVFSSLQFAEVMIYDVRD